MQGTQNYERWEAALSDGTLTSSFNYTFNFEIIADMRISVDTAVSDDLCLGIVRGSQDG